VRTAAPEAKQASGRSGLYSLLARTLTVPDESFHAALAENSLAGMVAELAAELPYPLPAPDLALAGPLPFAEFQADYLASFEVGVKGPPCPLYEGAFRKDTGRKAVMEELLRFYDYFGLKMSDKVRDLPDLLATELEFMHYLAFLEAKVLQDRENGSFGRQDLLRAQRDFLARHLAAWTPPLARKAEARGAPMLYCRLLNFLCAFVAAELKYLEQEIAG
jgi:DMSO reductase family type II enzyme chaperone